MKIKIKTFSYKGKKYTYEVHPGRFATLLNHPIGTLDKLPGLDKIVVSYLNRQAGRK